MGIDAIFDAHTWAAVPFHFWSFCFFSLGCIVGSFLNVCIYRMPLNLSVVSPPSHCPHCQYAIPFYLNIPLVTWLTLRGRCKNCGAAISPRYFVVELLTGLIFLACWLAFGRPAPGVAAGYCLLMAGLIVATFIDFEHFIIPDEITFGGMGAGLLLSIFLPGLHNAASRPLSFGLSLFGVIFGAGLVYGILRLGKLLFGKQKIQLQPAAKVVFTETALHLPARAIPYNKLFYWPTNAITFQARTLELVDRGYREVSVRVLPSTLWIGEEKLRHQDIVYMEADCSEIILPREAMGLGDDKFMGAIGTLSLNLIDKIFGARAVSGLLRLRKELPPDAKLVFNETTLHLPVPEIPYEELFYRPTDTITFQAQTIKLVYRGLDRRYRDVSVRLSPSTLWVGDEELRPEDIGYMEADCSEISLPREAMGLGDVKFMGAIGAFIGWQGTLFSLMVSSLIGAAVGIVLILAGKREWSSRMPYGPYIALAAVIWVFWGWAIVNAVILR